MGKKGPSRHIKREMSPKIWPTHRKGNVWAVRTSPGPHGSNASIPLLVFIRDILGYAETGKEAKMIINQGRVFVDGRIRRNARYPLGTMDVVSLPDIKQVFRLLPWQGGGIKFHPIKKDEAGFKLCQIFGKISLKGDTTQLNLHDGSNILLPDDVGIVSVNDVVKLQIPKREILEHIRFEPGVKAIISRGKSQGEYGTLISLGEEPGKRRTAIVRNKENEDVRTLAKYVFVVGSDAPLISLPGEL
jgi:small subunit ribosomal protein S4e